MFKDEINDEKQSDLDYKISVALFRPSFYAFYSSHD